VGAGVAGWWLGLEVVQVLEVCVVLELGMCWRRARYVVGALLELRAGVRSWGLSWIEIELGLEAGLGLKVGLWGWFWMYECRVLELEWCWG